MNTGLKTRRESSMNVKQIQIGAVIEVDVARGELFRMEIVDIRDGRVVLSYPKGTKGLKRGMRRRSSMVASPSISRQSKRPKSVCSLLAVGGAIVSAWTIRTLDACSAQSSAMVS